MPIPISLLCFIVFFGLYPSIVRLFGLFDEWLERKFPIDPPPKK
jgi:hypothetical protein